jgi:hypothetical protein
MLIMTGLFIIHQTPAVAQTACANNRSTFSGYDTAAGQANWGTQAQIDERVSDSYCTGATDNFATSWVMWVGNNNTSGRDGYSQAGWMQMSNQGACYFGEYDPDGVGFGSAFTRAFYCPGFQFGQTILYTTQFNSNCNCAQNLAGLINVNQTNFNPLQIWSNLRNTWASENELGPNVRTRQQHFTGRIQVPICPTTVFDELRCKYSTSDAVAAYPSGFLHRADLL